MTHSEGERSHLADSWIFARASTPRQAQPSGPRFRELGAASGCDTRAMNDDDHEPGLEEPSVARLEEEREAMRETAASGKPVDSDVRKVLLARIREKVHRADDR